MATTAWVRDVVEAASAGAYPTVQAATKNSTTVYAPSGGGTWYCFGICDYTHKPDNLNTKSASGHFSNTVASGAKVYAPNGNRVEIMSVTSICIKIA